jgi:hypothetical protein
VQNNLKLIVTAILASIIFGYGCRKNTDVLGSDIDPTDGLQANFVDTFTMFAYNEKVDSVRTDRVSSGMVGTFNDPLFGKVKSSVYANVRLTSILPEGFSENTVIDSVVLSLRYNGWYGNVKKLNGLQKFSLLRMGEKMTFFELSGTGYFSNQKFQLTQDSLLSEKIILPNLFDSVRVGDVNEAPQLRMKLKESFHDELLQNGTAFASNDAFSNFFNGFKLKSEPVNNAEGGIIYFNMVSPFSQMIIYGKDINGDLKLVLNIDQNSVWVNSFSHEFSPNIVFEDSIAGKDKLFLQAMNGPRVRINIPHIKELNKIGNIAVNKAELIVPVPQTELGRFIFPNELNLLQRNSEGLLFNLPDRNEPYFNGRYDDAIKSYRFVITRHIQDILNGVTNNTELVLEVSGRAVNAYRVIFNGTAHPINPIKFKLYYSKIN